jgi:hypothetical protein
LRTRRLYQKQGRSAIAKITSAGKERAERRGERRPAQGENCEQKGVYQLAVINTPAGKLKMDYWGGPYRLWLTAYKEVGRHAYTAGNCIGGCYLVRTAKGWQRPTRGVGNNHWSTNLEIDVRSVIPAVEKWVDKNPFVLKPGCYTSDVTLTASGFARSLLENLHGFIGLVDANCLGRDFEVQRILAQAVSNQ